MIPRLLYRLTANLPCRLISLDGAPYLERYLLARLGPLTVYLHRFVAPDGDEEVHDHPWRALSVVLAGGYFEERAALARPVPPVCEACGQPITPEAELAAWREIEEAAGWCGKFNPAA